MSTASQSSFDTGQANVTTAETPEQLDNIEVGEGCFITIKAKESNTGKITVGNTSAKALSSGVDHFSLKANESVRLKIKNLEEVWIDTTVSGEGIEWILEI